MNKWFKGGVIAALLLLLGTIVAKAFKNNNIKKISDFMKSFDDELDVGLYNARYKVTKNTSPTYERNNPGALMWFGDKWQGMDAAKTVHGKMIYFTTARYGARAQVITLLSYYRNHGLKSLYPIMNRYAPTSENDTEAYINWLATKLSVSPETDLRLPDDRAMLAKLAYFIHIYEAGFAWLDYSIFLDVAKEAK